MRSYMGFCLAMTMLAACGEPSSSTPNSTPDVGTDATTIDTGLPGDAAATTDVAEQTDILPDTGTVPGTDALTGDAATDAGNTDAANGTDADPGTDATGSDTTQPTCSSDGDCQTSTPCTVALCVAQACKVLAAPVGTPCDDANACTTGEKCAGTTCQAGTAVVCNDGDPCTTDACELASGCTKVASSGESCDDGDTCTTSDTCADGNCVGATLDCDDGNVCTTDYCGGGTCQHGDAIDGTACGDSDPCKVSGCDNGVCVAKPKLWSTPLSAGMTPKQVVATSVGVVVVSSKSPDQVLSWYDTLGNKIKEELGTTRFVSLTPTGNLVHARSDTIAMTDTLGSELWSTQIPEISDQLGSGLPSYTKIYAAVDGCYAVGIVQTGKFLRTAVARLSYTGVVEWQFATSPESGGGYEYAGTTLSDDGFLLSSTTGFFIPEKTVMFLTRLSKAGVIEAGPKYTPDLLEIKSISLANEAALAVRSGALIKIYADLQTVDLLKFSTNAEIERTMDGIRILRSGDIYKLNEEAEILARANLPISGPKMFSSGGGTIYLLSNAFMDSWLLHRLDEYGNQLCGACMMDPAACNDAQLCTQDACSATSGCSNKPNTCDDGLPCTLDACSPTSGCSHTPLELGTACSDNTVCTSDDVCDNGKCVGIAACPSSPCNTTTCNQFEGKPKCFVDPHLAGTACGDGGRCTSTQTCEMDFCETSVVIPAVPVLVAKQSVELPFDVSLTTPVKWVRMEAGGSDETTLHLKFNGQSYGYRPYASMGRRSGAYFAGEYPYRFASGGNVVVSAGLVTVGQWLLQVQATKNLVGSGFLDPTTITFGYQCPTP